MGGQTVKDRRYNTVSYQLDAATYNAFDAGGAADWANAEIVRMHEDGATATTVNGMVAPAGNSGNPIKLLVHDGTDPASGIITFTHESGSASAANRFIIPDEWELHFREGQLIWAVYDFTVSRWRLYLIDGRDPRSYYLSLDATRAFYNAGEKPIKDVEDPTDPQDAATRNFVETALATALPLAGGTMAGAIDCDDNEIESIKYATFNGEVDAGNSGASITMDFDGGAMQKVTLNHATPAITLAFPGPGRYRLLVVQDATGNRVASWTTPGAKRVSNGIAVLSTAANAVDMIDFDFDGTVTTFAFLLNLTTF
jgi:hypothetical protein